MRTAKGRNLTETVISQASLVSIVTLHVEVYVGDHWFSVVLVASTTSIFNFRISWRPVMCTFGLLCANYGMHYGA